MKWLAQFIALTTLIAGGTWWLGWWMAPVAAAVYGAWGARQRSAALTAMLAAAAAWGALLVYDASVGPVMRLSALFGTVFHLSPGTLLVVTLAYAGLLAATAAVCARGIRRLMTPA